MNLRGKACVVCGQVFLPGSGSQLTCSAECKKELRAIRKGKTARGPLGATASPGAEATRGARLAVGGGTGEEKPSDPVLEPLVTYIRSVAKVIIRREVGDVLREIFVLKGQGRRE